MSEPNKTRSHVFALSRKNWQQWRRTPFTSLLETLAPILLMGILVYLRSQVTPLDRDAFDFTEISFNKDGEMVYTTVLHYPLIEHKDKNDQQEQKWMEDNFSIAGVIPRSKVFFLPKSCFWEGSFEEQRKIVGLHPKNYFTQEIAREISKWKSLWIEDFDSVLDLQVKYFDTQEQLEAYFNADNYTQTINTQGMCFGISYKGALDKNWSGTKQHDFTLYFDDQDEDPTQNLPSQKNSPFDPLIKSPDIDSFAYYARFGFNQMQNWLANAVLQYETNVPDAYIVSLVKPMRANAVTIDEFAYAQSELLPLFMVLMYLLPIYRLTSHIVGEKQSQTRDLMKMLGVSEACYWSSWFLYFIAGVSLISLICALILAFAVLRYSQVLPILILFWLFGFALFGYVIFIQAFFRNPTTAAIVSTVLFFVSSFADYLVKDPFVPASYKMLASLFQPAIAMHRALNNLSELEQQGIGMTNDNMFVEIQNYRFTTAIVMLGFAGVLFMALGIYLSNVLPSAGGLRQHWLYCLGRKRTKDAEEVNEAEENSNIEVVQSRKLFYMKKNEQTLVITGLKKEFPNKFKAVNGLDLCLFEGQIFALLGHNGAGKTTTLRIITGLIEATSGRLQFFGQDFTNDHSVVSRCIGVCPQENVLFDLLTVREHLTLFMDLKRVASEGRTQMIEHLIRDLDLSDFKDKQVCHLSGGNKRKLQVGLALVGDSKLVLLDEPTAGLDFAARRAMWNLLKRYKKNKVIILTTHHMDEADYLGDRIGIMNAGQMVCLGTQVFLKNRFGVGVELSIVFSHKSGEQTIEESLKKITRFVQKEEKEAIQISFEGTGLNQSTVVFKFPQLFREQYNRYVNFFSVFDDKLEDMNVKSYSINENSLEKVFLEVTTTQTQEPKVFPEHENSDASRSKAGSHIRAIFKKRFHIYRRSLKTILMELIVPIILIAFGFGISTLSFYFNSPPRELVPQMFGDRQRIVVNENVIENFAGTDTNQLTAQQFVENLPFGYSSFDPIFIDYVDLFEGDPGYQGRDVWFQIQNDTFNAQFYNPTQVSAENFSQRGWGSYFLVEMNNKTKHFKFGTLVNATAQDATGAFPQFAYESILKMATGNPNLDFKITSKPFPVSKQLRDKQVQISGIFIVIVILVAFSLLPASVASYICHEREKNLKHQQLISGMSVSAYWVSNSLFDLFRTLVLSAATIGLVFAFKLDLPQIWTVLVLYPFALVPYTYVTSYLFRRETVAQNFTLFFHLVVSALFGIGVFLLRILRETQKQGDILSSALKILPSYAFADGVAYSVNRELLNKTRNYTEGDKMLAKQMGVVLPNLTAVTLNSFEWPNLGGVLLALGGHSVVCFMILATIEAGLFVYCFKRVKANRTRVLPDVEVDEDVLCEAQRVDNIENKGLVQVRHLHKEYNTQRVCCQRCNRRNEKEIVPAVSDISFGLEEGECFALLGVNGAGKTTCFKILTNEISKTSGEVRINGYDAETDFLKAAKSIGYCPQFDALFDMMSVEEHIAYYASLKGCADVNLEVERLVSQLGIVNERKKLAYMLSGGNKRRLSVAIALVGKPQVVLLDEPSAGLDPQARQFMWSVISNIRKTRPSQDDEEKLLKTPGTGIILTTHLMEEAEALSTKIGIMVKGGHFKCFGTSQHIRQKFGGSYELELKFREPSSQRVFRMKEKNNLHRREMLTLEECQILLMGESSQNIFLVSEIERKGLLAQSLLIHAKDKAAIQTKGPANTSVFWVKRVGKTVNKREIGVQQANQSEAIAENEQSQGEQTDLTGKSSLVTSTDFIVWMYIQVCLLRLIRTLLQSFQKIEVVEHNDNRFVLRVPRCKKSSPALGKLLSLLQTHQKVTNVEEFQVNETSLNQIFSMMAYQDSSSVEFIVDKNCDLDVLTLSQTSFDKSPKRNVLKGADIKHQDSD